MRALAVATAVAFALPPSLGAAATPEPRPILIGLDAEFGRPTGTADDAIRQGILIALDEINGSGGVLGGRKLRLVERDNRSVPARALQDTIELGADPEVVAIFCGRFSTAVLETIDAVHAAGIPLLDPWAAADKLVDNGHEPNYVFRLSLRDGWAIPAMLEHARRRGYRRLAVLVANDAWGRANRALIEQHAPARGVEITAVRSFRYGDGTVMERYRTLLEAKPDALLIVTSENEGAELVGGMAALPPGSRLPLISHWSIAGSDFPALAGAALWQVDLAVVQTWSVAGSSGKRLPPVLAAAKRLFAKRSAAEIVSPVGLAHAYDLTHLLARAIELAGRADRAAVRNALERLGPWEGLVKRYERPFTPTRHEALSASDVFMARYARDGTLVRIP